MEGRVGGIEEKKWTPMGKKHNWTDKSGGFFFKITIEDEFGRKLDWFKGNGKKNFQKILDILDKKFGLCIN